MPIPDMNDIIAFQARFEGRVPWMYQDIRGLVTTGIGCLIDPEVSLELPWRHRDADGAPTGDLATVDEISAEWRRIKGSHYLAQAGAQAAGKIATLALDDTGIDALAAARVTQALTLLQRDLAFSTLGTWPDEAVMGVLSMAWAMGPLFSGGYPRFTAACAAQNWATAADECWIDDRANPGLTPRNAATEALFLAAAAGCA